LIEQWRAMQRDCGPPCGTDAAHYVTINENHEKMDELMRKIKALS
jgi:hypothetical protein